MNNDITKTSRASFPVLLLGISTLCWAWTLDILPLGILMAIVLEIPHWTQRRIELKEKDIKNIANLTAVIFAIFCLNQFITQLHVGIYTITAWLPLIMFPLLLTQLYSNIQEIPLWTLLSHMRSDDGTVGNNKATKLDLRIPFFFISIIAGSIYGAQQAIYFAFVSILLLYFLWSIRPSKNLNFAWIAAACLVLVFSVAIQSGIYKLAGVVQTYTASWFAGKWNKRNTDRNSTAIGQVGKLKLSDSIALRVRSSYDNIVLLQQGVYNRYHGGVWHSTSKDFNFLARNKETDSYNLIPILPEFGNRLEIFADLTDGEGALALPHGSYQLFYSGTGDLSRNRFGITKISGSSEQLRLEILYRQNNLNHSQKPTIEDLEIAPPYDKLMNEIVDELGLKTATPGEAAQILKRYFTTQFQYSLIQDDSDIEAKPLYHFLKKTKKGHCEYFATTTALILRAAGIPTRYATGFLMTEYDPDEKLFVVRSRHAHAWTLAYIDNHWVELDFTPANWVDMEASNQSTLQPLLDTFSHWYYKIRKWWNSEDSTLKIILLIITLLIATLWLVKFFNLDRVHFRLSKNTNISGDQDKPSPSSPFYSVTNLLEKNHFKRKESDTLKQWLQHISESADLDPTPLSSLLDMHYQYRFSQHDDNSKLRIELQNAVDKWLEKQLQLPVSRAVAPVKK